MKTEMLLDAIGKIDDGLIDGALRDTAKRKRLARVKWGTVAACFAVAAVSAILLLPKAPGDMSELPMLSVTQGSISMGYEAYLAYDAAELVNSNPWHESLRIKTLPVFKNPITFDEKFHIAMGADYDRMKQQLLEIAERFGHRTDALVITDNAPSEETRQQMIAGMKKAGIEEIPAGMFAPTMLSVETEDMTLTVDQNLTVTVSFDTPISLPDAYTFRHDASYDEMAATADYLETEYRAWIGFKKPQANIHGGDYDTHHRQSYAIEFFDADGNAAERIVNYNFNRVKFSCDDDGNLFLIRFFAPDLSEKVGDYPIITADEAAELLENGNYITSVPQAMPGMAYVKQVELVYRTGTDEAYHMPYYRFYVELPGDADGLKSFGAYYVPAIRGEYIQEMPLWDGTFH